MEDQMSNVNDASTTSAANTTESKIPPRTVPKMTTVKEFRELLDKCMNSFKFILTSREVSLCFTNLQRAFHWIGESQKFTGTESPYIHSQNPASAVIEPTADHVAENDLAERWNPLGTHTARVKDLRQILSELISDFRHFKDDDKMYDKIEHYDCLNESFKAMKESKSWLGWELARIKKVQEGTNNSGPAMSLPL